MSSKELLMSQMIQIDTVSQLLIEKGLFTEQEFYKKLKQVQAEYQKKKKRPEAKSQTNTSEQEKEVIICQLE
jgi:hypothetical protein